MGRDRRRRHLAEGCEEAAASRRPLRLVPCQPVAAENAGAVVLRGAVPAHLHRQNPEERPRRVGARQSDRARAVGAFDKQVGCAMSGPPLGRPVALVTGAGGGLGGGIARALSAKGFALLLNDLAESSALTDLCAELRSAGAGVDVVAQDIAHVEELAAFVE